MGGDKKAPKSILKQIVLKQDSKLKEGVYFSGKITNSVIVFLKKNITDLSGLYELTDLSTESLQDPSSWMEAPKVEEFLRDLEQEYGHQFAGENFIEKIGHSSHDQRAWGVLDSVLRMMQKPQDIFSQPQRFLSYFISPAPPIAHIYRKKETVFFELPQVANHYPFVAEYLRSAFEALPGFMGSEMATAHWEGTKLFVSWSQKQENLFSEADDQPNLHPEFMQSLVMTLEGKEKDLEAKEQKIRELTAEVQRLSEENKNIRDSGTDEEQKAQKKEWVQALEQSLDAYFANQRGHLVRLGDYFTRAQQLITLLVGQDRMNKQVKEAMRRVDWETVRERFMTTLEETKEQSKIIQQSIQKFGKAKKEKVKLKDEKIPADLNSLVEEALSAVETGAPVKLHIDRLLFLDRPVAVYPKKLEQALFEIMNSSVHTMQSEGRLRVVTRPKGRRVEIEISDTGGGDMDEDSSQLGPQLLNSARSTIQMHRGHLNVISRKGEGSTYLIDLPL